MRAVREKNPASEPYVAAIGTPRPTRCPTTLGSALAMFRESRGSSSSSFFAER